MDSIVSSQEPNWNNTYLAAMSSTYYHSKELWGPVTSASQPLPCGLNPDQAIIAADAAGALIGLCIGGYASIIFGAVSSLAEAEDQENGVSVLVGSEYPESRYYKGPS